MMDCTSINGLQRRKRRNCARPARGLSGSFGLVLASALLILGFFGGSPTPGSGGLGVRAAYGQDFAAAGQHFASAQDAFAQGQMLIANAPTAKPSPRPPSAGAAPAADPEGTPAPTGS